MVGNSPWTLSHCLTSGESAGAETPPRAGEAIRFLTHFLIKERYLGVRRMRTKAMTLPSANSTRMITAITFRWRIGKS